MLKLNDPAEEAFLDAFDCSFPYEDDERATALIELGWSLSLNAAFGVLDELCRPPYPRPVGPERLRALVDIWRRGPSHPLKMPVLRCAEAQIEDEAVPVQEAFAVMRETARYEGQRAALGIAYFSADPTTDDEQALLESAYDEALRAWKDRGV